MKDLFEKWKKEKRISLKDAKIFYYKVCHEARLKGHDLLIRDFHDRLIKREFAVVNQIDYYEPDMEYFIYVDVMQTFFYFPTILGGTGLFYTEDKN